MRGDITVIIPVYNGEKYIERAIVSVLNQTLQPQKIIVVNDGSSDSTAKICKNLADKNNIIEVVEKKNGGISSARNCGLSFVTTKYVAFLDSDDEYMECFIQEMLNAIDSHDVEIAVCGYYTKNSDGSIIPSKILDSMRSINKNEAEKLLLEGEYLSSHPWNKVYKFSLFNLIRYPEGKNYEDVFIFPKLLDQCKQIVFVPEHLNVYYQINSSITHVLSVKNEVNAFEATYKRYLKYKNIYPEMISSIVKEPLAIAIRIGIKKKNKEDIIYYTEIENDLEDFLSLARKNSLMRKKLLFKYKIVLFIYPVLRGRIKY